MVKEQLRNPHRLIAEHKEEMEYRKKRDKELKRADFSPLYYAKVKSQFRDNKPVLPIFITHSEMKRAYRIMDTLIKAIEDVEGYVSIMQYERSDAARLTIMNTHFEFILREKPNHPKSLILSFKTTSWVSQSIKQELEFRDDSKLSLEAQVSKIIHELFVTANRIQRLVELEKREQNRKLDEEKRLQRLEKIRKDETEKIMNLLKVISDWDNANKIRKFVEHIEMLANEEMESIKREQYLRWAKWAKGKADWLDPLTASEDDLVGKKWTIFEDIIMK